MKYLTAAAAVWLFIGSALTSARALAQAQGVGILSAAPTAASSKAPSLNKAAPASAAQRAAPNAAPSLGPIDHGAWVVTHSPDLRPGDHVLVILRAPAQTAPASNAVPAATLPQAASRPEPRQTPAVVPSAPMASRPAPAAQAQPAAARTPSGAPAAVVKGPAPAATPKLSPIDHVLLVSVHPPGVPGPAGATDHAFGANLDHQSSYGWTPGRQLLASLALPPTHHLSEGEELLMNTADLSCQDPMSWSVIVHKSAYLVDVYYKGKHFASFPAVFGRNPDLSAKMWEGDLRTPEGNYIIVEKYYNPRWKWFLRLNYPNYRDRTRYDTMLDEGLVPVINGHWRPLGGSIGIHGTDRPRFNRLHINWTLGCISVDNDADEELDRILPIGTLVIIKP